MKRLVSAERAEEEVKAAADAINKQLPKEAQGGSLQPLVEEKEEGEAQPLDTFSSEIDSFDTVTTGSGGTLLPFDLSFPCCLFLSVFYCLSFACCLLPHAFCSCALAWSLQLLAIQGIVCCPRVVWSSVPSTRHGFKSLESNPISCLN